MRNWIKGAYQKGAPMPWDQPPAPVPSEEDIDSFIGRNAVEWLAAYEQDKPFYLQVQFTGPHDPFDSPQSYRDMYDPGKIDPGIAELPRPMSTPIAQATTAQRQRWRVNYYANVTLIDEWIGRILSVLEQKGLLTQTWILFNSDHGEMLGDHGLWSKANFYRQSVHVPCVLRPPTDGVPAAATDRYCDALVEHIDLPITMMDIAGAEGLENSVGQSLLPYVDPEAERPEVPSSKRAVVSELFGQSTIITDEHKLTVPVEERQPVQFFDLREDPNELRNVADEGRYKKVIASLIADHLDPIEDRISKAKLADYRAYVRQTGRKN